MRGKAKEWAVTGSLGPSGLTVEVTMKIKERAGSGGLTGVRMSAAFQLHPALVQAPLEIWPKALPTRLETEGKEGERGGGGGGGARLQG